MMMPAMGRESLPGSGGMSNAKRVLSWVLGIFSRKQAQEDAKRENVGIFDLDRENELRNPQIGWICRIFAPILCFFAAEILTDFGN
ncbi:MAG: hypothetical protein ABI162_19540 [Luteolibacter sp.]